MNFQFSIFNFQRKLLLVLFFAFILAIFAAMPARAATNIAATSTQHYAWNDNIGWIDFYSTGNVNVTSTQLSGYADSSVGYIALDCATSPNGDICATSNFKVSNNGSGGFSGWAYNDAIGWISFDSATASSSYFYQVTVNGVTGDFSGWAYNDVVGWISFNCLNDSSCGTSNYKLTTSWATSQLESNLISSIIDTGETNGVALNTIMWQGTQPAGTNVKFQIASNASLSGGGATGDIDTDYKYAWNDLIGWIDFNNLLSTVNVGTSQLTGYATYAGTSTIALDCATSPGGNICGTSDFKILRNSSTGDLSGYAWSDDLGWISFNCSDSGICATSNYKVNVNTSTGAFTGYAWNDSIGWISFNCSDSGICGTSDYRVNTSLVSSWNYYGPDGSATTYYVPSAPGYPAQITTSQHNNVRYFRYKIFIYSNAAQTTTPTVNDVIINYSP